MSDLSSPFIGVHPLASITFALWVVCCTGSGPLWAEDEHVEDEV